MSFIYIFILLLITACSLYEMYGNKVVGRFWFYSVVGVMILTAGLGYAIGPDWLNYWNAFEKSSITPYENLPALSEYASMEVGYLYFNKMVSSIGLGYASFTLILAFLSIYLKANAMFRYCGYVFLGLLMYMVIFYFYGDQVQVRQGLAMGFTTYSVRYIIERKLYYFLLFFLLAFLIHKSSIIFIFAYWVVNIKFNRNLILSIVSLAIIANYTGLHTSIDNLIQLLPFGVGERYDAYDETANTAGSIFGDLVKIFSVVAILIYDKEAAERDEYYPYFRNLYLLGVILFFFFGRGIFAYRLPNYYVIFLGFLAPRMVYAFKDNITVKNILYIAFLLYSLLMFGNMYINTTSRGTFTNYTTVFYDWVPYSFFLE